LSLGLALQVIWHDEDADAASASKQPDLSNVGLVVWESAWVLAEMLLRVNPLGGWAGARVLELGAGTGVTGMFLARAGAQVSQ
jgi:phospholipid N-methyltransferase